MQLGRIHTIDLLRGYFMMVIIIDHLERFPSGFDLLTGRGQLWVSAAEGFFFLSGMMIGMIRGRKDSTKPFLQVAATLARRALILYGWCVGLTLLFSWMTLQGYMAGYVKPGLWDGSITDMVVRAISLEYVYSWSDFLRYYAVYLVASIAVVWLLRKNLAVLVGLGSLALWWGGGQNEFQHWQLLFFGGVIAGWYWPSIVSWAKRLPRIIIHIHYPLALITIIASVIVEQGSLMPTLSEYIQPLFEKTALPWPRVAMFALWFSALYRLVSTHEGWLYRRLGWFFATLGRNSLYCYIISGFVIFGVHMFIPPAQPLLVNFLITTASLTIVWLATHRQFLFKIIPR